MGLLVFVTMFQLVDHDPVECARPEPTLAFDFTLDELPERELEVPITLRDNTSEGEWSRQVDYELVATHGRFTLAVNNHFIVRNIGEAQAVASYTIEY
jgi:hypothetical protein